MNRFLIFLSLAIISSSCAAFSSFDASRRYGPNSFIYNTPLYFNAQQAKEKRDEKRIQKKKNPKARTVSAQRPDKE